MWRLIQSLEREESTRAEREVWWRRVAEGNTDGVLFLARCLEEDGRITEAQQWLIENIGHFDQGSHPATIMALARSLEKTGNIQAAEIWLRRAADIQTGQAPEKDRPRKGAEQLDRLGLEPGGRTAVWKASLPPPSN
jgi:hypothetical protein